MWLKWAFGEAILRTIAIALYKVIGGLTATLSHSVLSVAIIGGVQVTASAVVLCVRRTSPFVSVRQVVGSVGFGIGAFLGTLLPIIAFSLGGNLAVYTFLALLAIIPGALIDVLFFKEHFGPRRIVGILIAISAGWLILHTPSLRELTSLPLWMLLALINACTLAINQGLTRWIKDVNTWVKNFWGGATITLLSCITLLFVSAPSPTTLTELILWSTGAGAVIIGLWTFNVLSYRTGANIPAKTIAVNGLYLTGALVLGALLFSEPLHAVQWVGVVLYVISFVLINKDVDKIFRR